MGTIFKLPFVVLEAVGVVLMLLLKVVLVVQHLFKHLTSLKTFKQEPLPCMLVIGVVMVPTINRMLLVVTAAVAWLLVVVAVTLVILLILVVAEEAVVPLALLLVASISSVKVDQAVVVALPIIETVAAVVPMLVLPVLVVLLALLVVVRVETQAAPMVVEAAAEAAAMTEVAVAVLDGTTLMVAVEEPLVGPHIIVVMFHLALLLLQMVKLLWMDMLPSHGLMLNQLSILLVPVLIHRIALMVFHHIQLRYHGIPNLLTH